jgi:hypothetical protein
MFTPSILSCREVVPVPVQVSFLALSVPLYGASSYELIEISEEWLQNGTCCLKHLVYPNFLNYISPTLHTHDYPEQMEMIRIEKIQLG